MPIYINNRRLIPMTFMKYDDEEDLGNPIDLLGDIAIPDTDPEEENP